MVEIIIIQFELAIPSELAIPRFNMVTFPKLSWTCRASMEMSRRYQIHTHPKYVIIMMLYIFTFPKRGAAFKSMRALLLMFESSLTQHPS